MRCNLYSNDGPLMSEGTCEMEDGAIKMVTLQWHMTPQEGGRPLALVMEDGKQYVVRVEDVHVVESNPQQGHTEVYRLRPLEGDQAEAMDGSLLDRVKSAFRDA